MYIYIISPEKGFLERDTAAAACWYAATEIIWLLLRRITSSSLSLFTTAAISRLTHYSQGHTSLLVFRLLLFFITASLSRMRRRHPVSTHAHTSQLTCVSSSWLLLWLLLWLVVGCLVFFFAVSSLVLLLR